MFKNLVPISKEQHGNKRLKPLNDFGFASDFHVATVMVHEFARASAVFPIVFLEDKAQDEFRPVAMLGLESGENLFVDGTGRWVGGYVPAIIRRYPFALASAGEEGQYTVCIDDASPVVNEEEGEALFKEDGEPSEALENARKFLGELQQMDVLTSNVCKYLAEQNMFSPFNMRVRHNEQSRNISGCYVVNEERLYNVSDERFLEMRNRRYLPAIYAHLASLSQIERLLKLKEERQTAAGADPASTDPASAGAAGRAAEEAGPTNADPAAS